MSAEYIVNEGGINRPMTKNEIAEYLELCSTIPPVPTKKEQTEKALAKEAVLAKLGLTVDEVTALLS